jgi:hypothetical protein
MVGEVVNCSISQAPITFVEVEGAEPAWFVAHVGGDRLPKPLPLVNGHFLYVYHLLGLRRKERYLATLEYRYTYQATTDDDSWIFRYEYVREPGDDYPYAKAHVHVNASPLSYSGAKAFPGLHMPTGSPKHPRVTIEEIIRHLVYEHEVVPISAATWEQTLADADTHFADVQKKRFSN